jgi:hypothetical protein
VIIIHNDEYIRNIVSNLDDIEKEIEKCIEAEDFDTMADWCDARVTWSEDLHLEIKSALENQS